MNTFSPSDAATTGFRLIRQRPALLGWWSLFHLVFISVSSVLTVMLMGPGLAELQAVRAQGASLGPQAQLLAMSRFIIPLYLVAIPITLAFYAVLTPAIVRAVLEPAESAFGYLRLGVDELRQFLLFLWAILLSILAYVVLAIGAIVIAAIIGVAVGAAKSGLAAMAAGFGVFGAFLLMFGAWIYLMVRFSLAPAMTFDRRKIQFLASWRLTKGRFWPMLGAYLLAWIFGIIVVLLGLVIVAVLGLLTGGGLSIFSPHPDMSSLAAYFTLGRLLYLVISAVLYALVWPVLLGPSVTIYRALTADASLETHFT